MRECGHDGIHQYLAGGLGLAAMAASAPAAAQNYPGYPGGGYGYPGGSGNVVNDILGQILGGRSYANNERYAVEQCVRAVEYRINTRGLDNEGGRYRQYGYNQGYNNRYGGGSWGPGDQRYPGPAPQQRWAEGLWLCHDQRRLWRRLWPGRLPQSGLWLSQPGLRLPNQGYPNQGYGNQAYGYGAQGDAQFDCTIDRSGRITDIDAKRNRNSGYGYRRY